MMEEGGKRVRTSYRENYNRFTSIKRRYDPDIAFRINQNIV